MPSPCKEIYTRLTACMVSASSLAWSSVRIKRSFSQMLSVLGMYGLALLVVMSPFLYRATLATPDLKRRWGMILIPRLHPLFLPNTLQLLAFGIAAVIVLRLLIARQEKLYQPGGGWR